MAKGKPNKPGRGNVDAADVRTVCVPLLVLCEWAQWGDLSPDVVERIRLRAEGDVDRIGYAVQGNRPDVPFTRDDAVAVLDRIAQLALCRLDAERYGAFDPTRGAGRITAARDSMIEALRGLARQRCDARNCGTVCKCGPCHARAALAFYDPEFNP